MSNHHILLTCGTSALGGFNYFGEQLRANHADLVKFHGPALRAAGDVPLEDANAEILRMWSAQKIFDGITDFSRVSAEISSIHALQKQGQLSQKFGATLLHTDTIDGIFSVELVSRVLDAHFDAHVRTVSIPDLDISNPARMRQGMAETMQIISNELRQHDPSSALFSPIGGYKVMTALAYAIASIHNYASVYLHESGQVVHTIPAAPMKIDGASLAGFAPLVRRLLLTDKAFTLELSPVAKEWEVIQDNPWFFECLDTLVTPSALGLYVFSDPQYRTVLWPKILVSPALSKDWNRLGSAIQTAVETIVMALQRVGQTRSDSIFHEQDFRNLKASGAQWHLYKVKAGSERFLWQLNAQKGALYFGKHWTDHAAYEREIRTDLIQPFTSNDRFEDMSEQVYKK